MAGADGGADKRVARLTFEILAPIPIGELELDTEIVRPGARVDLVRGRIASSGETVVLAQAWRFRTSTVEVPPSAAAPRGAPPPPGDGVEVPFFDTGADEGYHTAMQWRATSGSFREPGPAAVWLRSRVPLVDDRSPSPLGRVLLAADSGNGISASADPAVVLFVNTDLTVHLHRYPAGEWVHLDSRTVIDPGGVGLAATDLSDQQGPLGRSAQALYVTAR